ncbi:hypothetical protein ACA910_001004 [Epithemia clementina (nom. ined.)]
MAPAASQPGNDDQQQQQRNSSDLNVTVSRAPSHILQDGRFVILPDPSPLERRRFVERSIARHGLLQQYLQTENDDDDQNKNSTATMDTKGLDGTTATGDGDKKNKQGDDDDDDDDDDDKKEDGDDDKPLKVHPLVLASARLQNDGINELNRSINLATLVQTGEYFSLSNIVADSALELAMTEAATAAAASAATQTTSAATTTTTTTTTTATSSDGGTAAVASSEAGGGEQGDAAKDSTTTTGTAADGATQAKAASTAATATAKAAAASSSSSAATQQKSDMHQSQRIAATYILKQKHAQFRHSALQLQQHKSRLQLAIAAEHRPMNRLRQLRPHWRLVAPEHGTRAAPHAARPTEVLAADVDIYHSSQPGRLARRVPRYATVELKSNYKVEMDALRWKNRSNNNKRMKLDASNDVAKTKAKTNDASDVEMKDADESNNDGEAKDSSAETPATKEDEDYSEKALWTRAEPFAMADPTLGKIDADFDPTKVAMLTLEFAIEKPSTGFCSSACLQPFVVGTSNPDETNASDSRVLVALQHSLFCSKMFDSIRREVASDTEEVGQVRTIASQSERATIWIYSKNEQLFLPPPGSMVKGDLGLGQPVAVVHCHEGEVMVQLDCEYTLRIKLVEANSNHDSGAKLKLQQQQQRDKSTNTEKPLSAEKPTTAESKENERQKTKHSSRLLSLCRSLMLYAQEIYHKHSLHQNKLREDEQREHDSKPASGLALKRKTPEETSPRILQHCICLGSKILMERRVRLTLESVEMWLSKQQEHEQQQQQQQQQQPRRLVTEWLSLSALDPHGHFTMQLTGTSWFVDVHLYGDRMTVTSFQPAPYPAKAQAAAAAAMYNNNNSANSAAALDHYRKVDFHSELELELFLKRSLAHQLSRG